MFSCIYSHILLHPPLLTPSLAFAFTVPFMLTVLLSDSGAKPPLLPYLTSQTSPASPLQHPNSGSQHLPQVKEGWAAALVPVSRERKAGGNDLEDSRRMWARQGWGSSAGSSGPLWVPELGTHCTSQSSVLSPRARGRAW